MNEGKTGLNPHSLNPESSNTPPTPLPQSVDQPGKNPAQQYAPEFEAFWREYPRKIGKGAAYKSWGKLKPPLRDCLLALKWQKKSDQWTKDQGRFIPHPATWLNQRRWEDEKPIDPLDAWAMEG